MEEKKVKERKERGRRDPADHERAWATRRVIRGREAHEVGKFMVGLGWSEKN